MAAEQGLDLSGDDADAFETTTVGLETDGTIDEGKNCPVTTDANIFTRVNLGSALTNDDVSGATSLTTIEFDTTILWIAVTTVTA